MDWYIVVRGGFAHLPVTPGCVFSPGASGSFGFSRLLLFLLALAVLIWGSLNGHLLECIAAVAAAVLVDIFSRTTRQYGEG